jgi:DNA-binding YbaB/EbfC family protein
LAQAFFAESGAARIFPQEKYIKSAGANGEKGLRQPRRRPVTKAKRLQFAVQWKKEKHMAGIGDMFSMMKNAKQMMEKAKELKADLARRTAEGNAGAGMVSATMTGAGDLVALKIDRAAVTPDDPEMLADLVLAAVADARKKADALRADALREMTGGLDLSALGIDPSSLL